MSEAVRAVALAEANKFHQVGGPATDVVKTANMFLAFLQGAAGAPTKVVSAGAEPEVKKETKPSANTAGASQPADPKKVAAALKKAAAEEKAAAEALAKANAEAEAEGEEEPAAAEGPFDATAEGVSQTVSALIAAGKRQDAINLLKKYKAASVSGLQAKGDAIITKFVADGNALLGFEGEPDIEG